MLLPFLQGVTWREVLGLQRDLNIIKKLFIYNKQYQRLLAPYAAKLESSLLKGKQPAAGAGNPFLAKATASERHCQSTSNQHRKRRRTLSEEELSQQTVSLASKERQRESGLPCQCRCS